MQLESRVLSDRHSPDQLAACALYCCQYFTQHNNIVESTKLLDFLESSLPDLHMFQHLIWNEVVITDKNEE